MGIFSFNSPFMAFLTKVMSYVLLYLLSFVCSVPIVTVGASTTARYYVAMKMVRGEEPAIIKPFFKSFASNFKQSTIVWLIEIAVAALLIFDWRYILQLEVTTIVNVVKIALIILTILCVFAGFAAFPLIARYEMKTKDIVRAAFMFAFLHPFRMLLLIFWVVVPFYLALRYPRWLIGVWPVVPTLAMYFNSKMFMKQFSKLEEKRSEHAEKMKAEAEGSEENSEDAEAKEGEAVLESEEQEEAAKEPALTKECDESEKGEETNA